MIEYCSSVILRKEKLTKDIFKLVIKKVDNQEWKPGNFAMILPELKIPFFSWRRAFSLFDLKNNKLEFLIKNVGKITNYLEGMSKGEKISYIGPLGNSFIDKAENKGNKILVAGGIGIAPLNFYAHYLLDKDEDFYFLYGAANKNELIQLRGIKKELTIATEDGSEGYKGNIIDLLINFLREKKYDEIYLCGPTAMLKYAAEKLRGLDCKIYISIETIMACGFGVCRGCPIPVSEGGYKMACKDGPIFNIREIEWEKIN